MKTEQINLTSQFNVSSALEGPRAVVSSVLPFIVTVT